MREVAAPPVTYIFLRCLILPGTLINKKHLLPNRQTSALLTLYLISKLMSILISKFSCYKPITSFYSFSSIFFFKYSAISFCPYCLAYSDASIFSIFSPVYLIEIFIPFSTRNSATSLCPP